MEDSKELAKRFREVLLDGKWIANTNWRDQLSGVSYEQAVQKVGSLNTIAALAFHINYYIAGVSRFFESGALEISDKYSFDLPPLHTAADWEQLRSELWISAEKFAGQVEIMTNEQLDQVFVKAQYGTYRRNIEGMIEHCYYHLGQISLIRKMIGE